MYNIPAEVAKIPPPILALIDAEIEREGGYSNDPNDAGGETKYGIAIRTARSFGYQGRMIDLDKDTARAIYYQLYVSGPQFDEVFMRSAPIGAMTVDTGINMGQVAAGQMLQRVLNVLNHQGKDYPDLIVDGHVGAKTLYALDRFLHLRGATGTAVLLDGLRSLKGAHYITLAEAKPSDEKYTYGWLANRLHL